MELLTCWFFMFQKTIHYKIPRYPMELALLERLLNAHNTCGEKSDNILFQIISLIHMSLHYFSLFLLFLLLKNIENFFYPNRSYFFLLFSSIGNCVFAFTKHLNSHLSSASFLSLCFGKLLMFISKHSKLLSQFQRNCFPRCCWESFLCFYI